MASSIMPETLANSIFQSQVPLPISLKSQTLAGNVQQFNNVTILFADICGFTTMSSNLDPSELVRVLDDLFYRFDGICAVTGCEKIAILGDCYQCVSGCPDPREDHAHCCVETGLGMCRAVSRFGNMINIRVGIHTGRVIGGIVGLKRYKFDVWSNDVTLANKMQSSGEPGQVHISEDTFNLVKNDYEIREGAAIDDIRKHNLLREVNEEATAETMPLQMMTLKTYFVKCRRKPCKFQKLTDDNEIPDPEPRSRLQSLFLEKMRSGTVRASLAYDVTDLVAEDQEAPNTFSHPPLNTVTLKFLDASMEQDYKQHTADPAPSDEVFTATEEGFQAGNTVFLSSNAPSHFAFFLVSIIISVSVLVTCFATFNTKPYFIVTSIASFVVIIVPFFLGLPTYSFVGRGRPIYLVVTCLVLLQPALCTLLTFSCDILNTPGFSSAYFIVFIISLLQISLFANVSYLIRGGIAAACTITIIVLLLTPSLSVTSSSPVFIEAVISIISVNLVLWLISRESELVSRLSWYSAAENGRMALDMQEEEIIADELAKNVIPERIITEIYDNNDQLQLYHHQHNNCGVLFASIKNFGDLYEESCQGDDDYLGIHNKLFVDFEKLLDLPKYQDIEKIKTIGPCLMVASGLDNDRRYANLDQYAHLYALIDYGFALIKTVEKFNRHIPGFTFKICIGVNAGPLVSGVIGSTKLHYDIWGDTVNVASRMYSEGKEGQIQVSEDVVNMLKNRFDFQVRGTIPVKGKPDTTTYFVVRKKTGVSWK